MKTISFNTPTGWEKLSNKQLIKIAPLYFTGIKGIDFDVRLLMELVCIKWYQVKRYLKFKYLIGNVPLETIKENYRWAYDTIDRKTFLPLDKIQGTACKSPAPFLLDVSIAAFAAVDDLYMKSRKAPKQERREYLEYIAGILYAPCIDGSRASFKKESIQERSLAFKKVDDSFLYAMIITYQGCRSLLEKRYKRVFAKAQTAAPGVKTAPKKQYGFGKVILEMAGGKFGNYADTAATPLHAFMEQFNEDLKPN